MTHPNRRPSGFTLIELMVVVCIVGLLASVALPTYGRMVLRSKAAERLLITRRIKQSVEDYMIRHDAVPGGFMIGAPQPAGAPGVAKRFPKFSASPGWKEIMSDGEVQGNLYYSYDFWVLQVANVGELYVHSSGDLDGDGILSDKQQFYLKQGGAFQILWELPAAGGEDQLSF